MARVKQAPAVFDLVFTLADASDNENDPTVPWPETRPHIVETGNESHRFMHSTAVAKKRIKAREQAKKAEPF